MPGNELTLQLYCLPDSLGKFTGDLEVIVSGGGAKRYLLVNLVGYGSLGTGTVVTDNNVSGVWDQEGSPYYIVDHIFVGEGQKLTIAAGTRIITQSSWQFDIGPDAQLLAKGSETDSIYFSALNSERGWEGLSFISSGADDTLSFCVFLNGNAGDKNGGAIKIETTNLMINNSKFQGNKSANGGAIYAKNSNFKIIQSKFFGNHATYGGAIYLLDSDPLIENNYFYSNQADFGDILTCKSSSLFVQNITTVNYRINKFDDVFALLGNNKLASNIYTKKIFLKSSCKSCYPVKKRIPIILCVLVQSKLDKPEI